MADTIADLAAKLALKVDESSFVKGEDVIKAIQSRMKKMAIDAALASTDVNKAMATIGLPSKISAGAGGGKGPAGVANTGAKILGTLKAVAIGWAGLKSIKLFAGWAEDTVEMGSRLNDLSEQTGINTTALQEYAYAAKLSGSSLEAVTAAAKKFNAGLTDAAKTGKGPVADGLRSLGLSVSGISKIVKKDGIDAGINLIAERISKLPNGSKKAAAAMDLFGKTGAELIPTLNGLTDARREFAELGLGIEPDDIKKLDEFGDQTDKVKSILGALRNQAVVALLPVLKEGADALLSWYKANRVAVNEKIVGIAKLIGSAFKSMVPIIKAIGSGLGFAADHWKVFATIGKISMLPITVAIKFFSFLLGGVPGLFDAIGRAGSAIGRALVASWEAVKTAAGAVVDFFVAIPDILLAEFTVLWDGLVDGFKEAIDAVLDLPGVSQLVGLANVIGTALGNSNGVANAQQLLTQAQGGDAGGGLSREPGQGGNKETTAQITIGDINVTPPTGVDPEAWAEAMRPHVRDVLHEEFRRAVD